MEFTKLPTNTFTNLQLNAGIMVDDFTPETATIGNIMGATTGGFSFASNPTYVDFGEDVDNCPPNTWQLKRVQYYDPAISGTFLTVTAASAAQLVGGADVTSGTAKVTPRTELKEEDFKDVWVIGDYSDKNTGANAGYLALHVMNTLNTAGFQWTTTKDGKGQFAFDFHGHYDMENIDEVPFELYVKAGTV